MRIAYQAEIVLLLSIAAVSASSASAQTVPAVRSEPRAEIALAYNLVRTNAPPGGCGCFLMHGGSASFAYRVSPSVGLIAEGGAVTNSDMSSGHDNLTLATYFDGARYSMRSSKRITLFGQVSFGFAHAYGSLAPSRLGLNSSTAFAMNAGGGVDLNLSRHVAWRLAQTSYLFTLLPNKTSDYQSSFRFQSGIVIRLSGS